MCTANRLPDRLDRSGKLPIVVSGAGIAGLTCALALARFGYNTIVVEKSEKLETVGAGIQLSPNAVSVFSRLGIAQRILKHASFPESIRLRDGRSGNVLANLPLGRKIQKKFGNPYCVIHRGDLQDALLSAVNETPKIALHLNSGITGVEERATSVNLNAMLNSQEKSFEAAGLVVADGIWSKLREDYLHFSRSSYTGKIAWRSVVQHHNVKDPTLLETTNVWFSPYSHVVSYPIRSGDLLNLIVIENGNEEDIQQEHRQLPNRVIASNWNSELRELLATAIGWSGWPMYCLKPPVTLARGKIALIGDAGHAMLPFAAQGAAMAVEDAAVLALELSETSDVANAFANYAAKRVKRVTSVMKLAEANGKLYHLPYPLDRGRNLGIRMAPDGFLMNRQDWIYQWISPEFP